MKKVGRICAGYAGALRFGFAMLSLTRSPTVAAVERDGECLSRARNALNSKGYAVRHFPSEVLWLASRRDCQTIN